jgi:hypothetical protein
MNSPPGQNTLLQTIYGPSFPHSCKTHERRSLYGFPLTWKGDSDAQRRRRLLALLDCGYGLRVIRRDDLLLRGRGFSSLRCIDGGSTGYQLLKLRRGIWCHWLHTGRQEGYTGQ